jgi:hypothetical protein
MKIKKLIIRNSRIFGLGGVISSWLTIGMVWAGIATFPLIGFMVTGGLFGLALIGTAQ